MFVAVTLAVYEAGASVRVVVRPVKDVLFDPD
jgi:hypothetical protein